MKSFLIFASTITVAQASVDSSGCLLRDGAVAEKVSSETFFFLFIPFSSHSFIIFYVSKKKNSHLHLLHNATK